GSLDGTANDDSYRFSFSFTVTRTNTTVEPSGEICGSAIHVNFSRSFSVTSRLPAARGVAAVRLRVEARRTSRARRIANSFERPRYYQLVMSVRDILIVGAGPSGLSAAIAARRRGLDYQVL